MTAGGGFVNPYPTLGVVVVVVATAAAAIPLVGVVVVFVVVVVHVVVVAVVVAAVVVAVSSSSLHRPCGPRHHLLRPTLTFNVESHYLTFERESFSASKVLGHRVHHHRHVGEIVAARPAHGLVCRLRIPDKGFGV